MLYKLAKLAVIMSLSAITGILLGLLIMVAIIDNTEPQNRPKRLHLTQIEYLDVEKAYKSGGLDGNVPDGVKTNPNVYTDAL